MKRLLAVLVWVITVITLPIVVIYSVVYWVVTGTDNTEVRLAWWWDTADTFITKYL